jgi:transcriptional regulator with PAS, ATPase and Fis domain
MADGGTIFLDEIGELPLSMQPKLLRFLQDQEFVRVGSSRSRKVDVRIIAATNKDLHELMSLGKFRADLFYRLSVISISIPPLRQREGDVLALSKYFIRQLEKKYNKKLHLLRDSQKLLFKHSWPGNVRELQNCLEYAAIMCQGNEIMPAHLPRHLNNHSDFAQQSDARQPDGSETGPSDLSLTLNWRCAMTNLERGLLERALSRSQGNRSQAIRLLGLSRRAFYHKLKQYQID